MLTHQLLPLNLEIGRLYRLFDSQKPELNRKWCRLLEYRQFTRGDINRCRVVLANADGTDGDEWLVSATCLFAI